MKFDCQQLAATSNQWKSWYAARIICFYKSSNRNCTISTGIPNLGVWCEKKIQKDFRSRTKNPTLTANPSVLRNSILTPQPWLHITSRGWEKVGSK